MAVACYIFNLKKPQTPLGLLVIGYCQGCPLPFADRQPAIFQSEDSVKSCPRFILCQPNPQNLLNQLSKLLSADFGLTLYIMLTKIKRAEWRGAD